MIPEPGFALSPKTTEVVEPGRVCRLVDGAGGKREGALDGVFLGGPQAPILSKGRGASAEWDSVKA